MPRPTTSTSFLRVAGVEAQVTYKPIRNLRLRVLPPDGRVAVSVPVGVSEDAVRSFVAGHREWIAGAQARVQQLSPGPRALEAGGRARIWGTWHDVILGEGDRPSAQLAAAALVLSGGDEESRRRALEQL